MGRDGIVCSTNRPPVHPALLSRLLIGQTADPLAFMFVFLAHLRTRPTLISVAMFAQHLSQSHSADGKTGIAIILNNSGATLSKTSMTRDERC